MKSSIFASSLALAGTALALSAATPTNALTFNWSFVTDSDSTGGAGQTISGTISGLVAGDNDGTGVTVTVDSTPTGELTSGGWTFSSSFFLPAFTVNSTGTAVTSASAYFARNPYDAVFFGLSRAYIPKLIDGFDSSPNWFTTSPNTFTLASSPAPTATPEPDSVVALLGLGALSLAGRKLRR